MLPLFALPLLFLGTITSAVTTTDMLLRLVNYHSYGCYFLYGCYLQSYIGVPASTIALAITFTIVPIAT